MTIKTSGQMYMDPRVDPRMDPRVDPRVDPLNVMKKYRVGGPRGPKNGISKKPGGPRGLSR